MDICLLLKWQNQAPIKIEGCLGKEEGEIVQNLYLFCFVKSILQTSNVFGIYFKNYAIGLPCKRKYRALGSVISLAVVHLVIKVNAENCALRRK